MRSVRSKTYFFNEMKKSPEQQEVLDKIDTLTKEDIEKLTKPHFPKWVKVELLKILEKKEEFKLRGNKTAEQEAEELAAKFPINTTHKEEIYPVYIYNGIDCEVGVSFKLSLKNNDMFAVLDQKNCILKISLSVKQCTQAEFDNIISCSKFETNAKMNDYILLAKEYLNNKYGSTQQDFSSRIRIY